MTSIGAAVSRVRNTIKAVKEDVFITDRFIWSLILKYAQLVIRDQESINQLLKFNTLFKSLPCLELIEIDRVEACCGGITSDCLIKRTKNPIPAVMVARFGPLFRTVSSIDDSQECFPTSPSTYTSMTKTSTFKYNKRKYYWLLNNYLYFPDLEWESIKVDAIFQDDITKLGCSNECIPRQDQDCPIPDFLFAKIESLALKDFGLSLQIPDQGDDNKMSQLR